MDLTLTPEQQAFRHEVRDWVTANLPPDIAQKVAQQQHLGRDDLQRWARILGAKGTVEWLAGTTDMVSGKSVSGWNYLPEKMNNPTGEALHGADKGEHHYANFVDCVRSRKQPNASVELGYRSAIAAHMSNLSYRRKQRVTLNEARQMATR